MPVAGARSNAVCRSANVACRSLLQRQKKGRQGKTANILHELRAKETPNECIQPPNISGISPSSDALQVAKSPEAASFPGRCHFTRAPGLVNPELIRACSEYFFARMRGTVPILHTDSFKKQVEQTNDSLHAYCIVAAFCAFVIRQTGFCASVHGDQPVEKQALVEEATEARRHLDPLTGSSPCDPTSQTDYTTNHTRKPPIRRWSLYRCSYPRISLSGRPLPPLRRDLPKSMERNHASCSMEALVQLEQRIQAAVPPDLDLPDVLMADLRVSQQWLRIMIWQLSTTAGFLSTKPTHGCMDFRYPLLITQDLCLATWKLSRQSMETHGIGLVCISFPSLLENAPSLTKTQIEKIFEVTCTLIDVMACLSAAGLRSSGSKLGPQDYLKHFFTLIHDLPGGRPRFLPLLLTKMSQTLPSMMESITVHLNLQPGPLVPDSRRMDSSTSMMAGPGCTTEPDQANMSPGIRPDDSALGNFNYAEMSRIGDKTPEIDEVFLQYSSYFS
ncbi:hypothetical protein NUU61_007289 [Penicillium alfredii]|uniref:Transcription factor domain-containing protein n=1 Tax=Penicillium alfredii TaxID=1506179 RepID=A0A9W9F2L2_9EURO|nr:uncharacterized protein NUU61_007289 [Penicillium alfredii]KAJ5092419.1 hypothetical protein NUU61_007289 [Penicillium alfredii]